MELDKGTRTVFHVENASTKEGGWNWTRELQDHSPSIYDEKLVRNPDGIDQGSSRTNSTNLNKDSAKKYDDIGSGSSRAIIHLFLNIF